VILNADIEERRDINADIQNADQTPQIFKLITQKSVDKKICRQIEYKMRS